MKESTKIRLFAIVAALLLGLAGCVFGQDVKARSFRDESSLKYDVSHYFNIALITKTNGVLEQTDSVQIFVRELGSKEAAMFTACEKTDLYFAYDKCYIVLIHRRGCSTVQLSVNAGVKVKEYGNYIPVNLTSGEAFQNAGLVVWDSRISDIHYYPESGGFISGL